MTVFRIDASIGKPQKIGAGTRVPIYTGNPETPVEVAHGLGRVPVDIWITSKDRWCDFYVVMKDRDRAVLVFREAKVNLYLRFE